MHCDEDLTLAAYLTDWLRAKEETLKATTFVRYRDYVRADLIPSFGRIALQDLRPRHITAWQESELTRGRGRTTVYRMGATLPQLRYRVVGAETTGVLGRLDLSGTWWARFPGVDAAYGTRNTARLIADLVGEPVDLSRS